MVMMFKYQRWKITLVWTFLIFQIFWLFIESYNLKCPSLANWKLRAQVMCNITSKYFCLFDIVNEKYVEGCYGPDWDRKGSKRIYSGDFSRGKCKQNRFQPFTFWTNGSVSDCIFAKTICSEKGQIIYSDNSTKNDRACRCDYKKKYSFISTPRKFRFCMPAEEDCSCYIKSCPVNFTVSADYRCIERDFKEKPNCKNITKYNETEDEKTVVYTKHNHLYFSETAFPIKLRDRALAIILFLFILYIIVPGGMLLYADSFNKWISEKFRPFERRFEKTNIDVERAKIQANMNKVSMSPARQIDICCERTSVDKEQNVERAKIQANMNKVSMSPARQIDICCERTSVDKEQKQHTLPTVEVNVLRIIHLLFRVACPVVRMIFNNEIQPNQLRNTLDKNKALLDKLYRRKVKIINDFQWNLLFKGGPVSSDDFDIRLMIYLLRTLANIGIGDIYPAPINTSISAMLSRIKYIRNIATQSCEGKLSEDHFNRYWDDIGQAVLKLVSSFELDIDNDQEKIRLIGRLLALNPIQFDNTKLCLFIDMSTTYPAMILQKLIFEYCSFKQVTIEDVLITEKHQLYHKRMKPEACCKCDTAFSSSTKVIPEEEWKALYEIKEGRNLRLCASHLRICCQRYVPKRINTCDLTVVIALILNIPDMLTYMITRLCASGIDKFLMQHKHTIYHSMERNRCCKCHKDYTIPTKKTFIIKGEWDILFMKEDYISCSTSIDDCCCQYSVRNSIQYTDDILWSKIFYAAGPISVLRKIKEDALSYFLHWTVDDQALQNTLTELLQLIQDEKFCSDMLRRTSSFTCSESNDTKTNKFDAYGWFSKHLQHQTVTTVPALHIAVLDKSGLNMKSLQIPTDFPLHHNRNKLTDLSSEENNFLLVVHGLTKVVYPVIKKEFDTQCPDQELDKIRMDIYEQHKTEHCKDSQKDKNKSWKKKVYLTENQQRLLFSPNKEESRNLDLKLMIYILKRRTKYEGKKEYANQLEVIDSIRRKIVHSSSGTLSEKSFKEIMTRIGEAILHLGGKFNEEKLVNLQHMKTF